MRTRTKTNELTLGTLGPISVNVRKQSDNSLIQSYNTGSYGPYVIVNDEETMVDDISKGRHPKSVIHRHSIIRRNVRNAEEYYIPGDVPAIWNVNGSGAHWLSWNPYGDINHRNINVNWSESEGASVRKARDNFFSMNEVDSLLNAVEAPELVTTLSPLYNKVNGVKLVDEALISKVGWRRFLKNTKNSLGILSGGFLYYSFGVAPLISDMHKISKSVASYKRKLDRALRKAGTVETVRYKSGGSVSEQLIADETGSLPPYYGDGIVPNGSWWHSKPLSLEPPHRIVTVRGIRSPKYYSGAFAQLDYLVSRFGVTGPASFAWERIPFSFVLDWFLDLSDVFNGIDNALTGNSKTIKDITVSEKWHVLCPVIKHLRLAGQASNADGQQTALVELSQYHRKLVTDTTSVGPSDRFGKKQGLLTAALIGTFATNLKSKSLLKTLSKVGK